MCVWRRELFHPVRGCDRPSRDLRLGSLPGTEEIGGGHLHVDFNLAYNPYCAYNDRWSCPIPPRQNRISVRIEAGEKKFHE